MSSNEYVTFKGYKIHTSNYGTKSALVVYPLFSSHYFSPHERIPVTDISDLIGLKKLTNLSSLNLARNQITEIKELENLINLE